MIFFYYDLFYIVFLYSINFGNTLHNFFLHIQASFIYLSTSFISDVYPFASYFIKTYPKSPSIILLLLLLSYSLFLQTIDIYETYFSVSISETYIISASSDTHQCLYVAK